MKSSLPVRIARWTVYFLMTLVALAVLGCFMPSILVLGEVGPLLIANFGPWIVVLSVLGAALLFRRWRTSRRRGALVVAFFGAFAAVGAVFVQAQQIAVANANGATIDIAQTFLARSQKDASLKPVTIVYAHSGRETLPLDIYQPDGTAGGGSAPIFIYVHGGGWGAETLKQRQADFRWFAERGYLVISIEYSLSSETRPTWNMAQPQLGCALAWVGANAARFGGDPARVAMWGESAGGNLILNVSYMANEGKLKPSCRGAVPKIGAAIALYPVVDPARMHANPRPIIGIFGRMMTENYTGGTPAEFPARYAEIGSSTHIGAAAPPTLLIVPEADHLVVPEAAYAFAARARAAGVETSLVRFPYAEHSFDLRSGGIGNQFVRQAMLQFLQQRGMEP